MKQLFKVYLKNYKEFFVVAENFQKAVDYLEQVLDANDYYYSSERKVVKVELIAIEDKKDDRQYFFDSNVGHLLIT